MSLLCILDGRSCSSRVHTAIVLTPFLWLFFKPSKYFLSKAD